MTSIYKFAIGKAFGYRQIYPCAGSRFIDAQEQDGQFVLWYEIPEITTADMPTTTIWILPTGMNVFPEGLSFEHLKTIQSNGLVYHIYKEI